MKLYGDQLAANQFVCVDGKPIMAAVKELDSDEGWVDIILPVVSKVVELNAADAIEAAENGLEEEETGLAYEVKRLTGKIQIGTLKTP